MRFAAFDLDLPDLDPLLANYCVLSGKWLSAEEVSLEHPLAMVLGGPRSGFGVPTSRKLNNEFGSKVEQRVAKDPIIKFGRRDGEARGHRRASNEAPFFKNVGLMNSSNREDFKAIPRDYKLMIMRDGPILIENRTGTIQPKGVFSHSAAITELNRPISEMIKLCIKTSICLCWRILVREIERKLPIETMREASHPDNDVFSFQSEELSFLVDTVELSEPLSSHFARAVASTKRANLSSFMICDYDGYTDFALSCLGYFVSFVQVQTRGRLLPDMSEIGQRVVVVFDKSNTHFEKELPQ